MSEEEITDEKRDKRSTKTFIIAVAIIIVAFIIILVVQSRFKPSDPKVEFNGFIFEKDAGLWHTQWQRDGIVYNIRLHYNPYEIEDILITGTADERFNQPEVYITFDPEAENLSYVALSAAEVSINLANAFDLTPVAACSENKTLACSTRPIITCDNTNASVIYLKSDEPTLVDFRGNCLVLQGKDSELLRASERFLYSWYRIMR